MAGELTHQLPDQYSNHHSAPFLCLHFILIVQRNLYGDGLRTHSSASGPVFESTATPQFVFTLLFLHFILVLQRNLDGMEEKREREKRIMFLFCLVNKGDYSESRHFLLYYYKMLLLYFFLDKPTPYTCSSCTFFVTLPIRM